MLFAVDVRVVLKKGILDAEAETVWKSLNLLGIDVMGVETAKVYTLLIESEEAKWPRGSLKRPATNCWQTPS